MSYGTLAALYYQAFGVMAVVECFVGATGNLMTLLYFSCKKNKTASSVLYIFINVSDIIICLLMFPVGLAGIYKGESVWFKSEVYCVLWGIAWSICIRISAYLICILSISRTLSLLRPLHYIKKRRIVQLTTGYSLILFFQSLLPFFYKKSYYYNQGMNICLWELVQMFPRQTIQFKTLFLVSIAIEFILPALPIIISGALSAFALSTRRIQCSQSKKKVRATVTVIMLTLSYIVFNLPLCITLTVHCISLMCNGCIPDTVISDLQVAQFTNYFLSSHAFALNGITNMFIYYFRVAEIRIFIRDFIRNFNSVWHDHSLGIPIQSKCGDNFRSINSIDVERNPRVTSSL